MVCLISILLSEKRGEECEKKGSREEFFSGADTEHTIFMNALSSLSYRDRVQNKQKTTITVSTVCQSQITIADIITAMTAFEIL